MTLYLFLVIERKPARGPTQKTNSSIKICYVKHMNNKKLANDIIQAFSVKEKYSSSP